VFYSQKYQFRINFYLIFRREIKNEIKEILRRRCNISLKNNLPNDFVLKRGLFSDAASKEVHDFKTIDIRL
jgi:hypothetical protein